MSVKDRGRLTRQRGQGKADQAEISRQMVSPEERQVWQAGKSRFIKEVCVFTGQGDI